jgi:crotonobetainyl-CoA:carnitine CoA-transferase CaiB-like acyl-CoA transferase
LPLPGLRVVDLTDPHPRRAVLLDATDLGADSDAVLRQFGYSPDEIARLRKAGVV